MGVHRIVAVLAASLMAAFAFAANAQDTIEIVWDSKPSPAPSDDDLVYIYCAAFVVDVRRPVPNFYSQIFSLKVADSRHLNLDQAFEDQVKRTGRLPDDGMASCLFRDNRAKIEALRRGANEKAMSKGKQIVMVDFQVPTVPDSPPQEETVQSKAALGPNVENDSATAGLEGEAEGRARRQAEEEARLAKEAAEREAEERRLAEASARYDAFLKKIQDEARAEAERQARVRDEWMRKRLEHQKAVEEAEMAKIKHERELASYEKAKAQHARCVAGDKAACTQAASQASTDTDANICVTDPALRLNASFQGNTAASIINGCDKPVDVRICLMRSGGWNCAVTWGLAPRAQWSHSSFDATGEVFMDAKTSGSGGTLSEPAGL